MILDAHWRKLQRRFMYRQKLISDFLNSPQLDQAFQTRQLNFLILDPFARNSKEDEELKEFVSISKILSFPTIYVIYIGLAILSILIAILLVQNATYSNNAIADLVGCINKE
jgi:hypothetical protein